MANPHFEIKITKRSKRQSAVAGAAYQSGENLFSEYDQKHKDYRKKEGVVYTEIMLPSHAPPEYADREQLWNAVEAVENQWEYDQKHKDYRKKEGVVYTEIMLPSHAPPEYADREQLWNAVEAVENQWNAQLARRFVLALPREVPEELYPQMVLDYCNQFFVSKGMIVDFAIHDPKHPQMVLDYCNQFFVSKGMIVDFAIHDPKPPGHNPHCHVMLTMRAMDEHGKWLPDYCNQFFVSKGMIVDFAIHDPKPPGHNPHCHVMLTMRAMDEHGKWLPKARKVYDLDENGERIRLPSGNWKSHKEDTVDWNEQYHGQEWRTGWETVQNRYLKMVNSPVRVDLRSYEKQGLDIIPTVHMGAAVTQMERRGIQTNIGNLNRDIKAANRMMSVIRSTIQNLRDWISDILETRKELLAEKKPENASPDLINLLRDYLNLRKEERQDWSRYGQQKGATKDLQSFVNATNYLKDHEIFTLEQLDSVLEEVKQKSGSVSTGMRKAESRMKVITGIQNAVADCQQHKAVHDKYVRIGWKTVQSVYAESHRDELEAYNKAYRFLKKHGVDLNVDLEALQAEYEQLQTSHAEYTGQLAAVQEELKPLKEIRYWVNKVLAPEQAEVKKKPEPKHSVTEQIKDYQEESRKKDEQHRQEKKQNMEL